MKKLALVLVAVLAVTGVAGCAQSKAWKRMHKCTESLVKHDKVKDAAAECRENHREAFGPGYRRDRG